MIAKNLPSPELLRKLLRYEPDTGKLTWRERPREFCKSDRTWKWWNNRFSGTEAGNINAVTGYRNIGVFGNIMRAHRIIWAMENSVWPEDQIDHINHDRLDNRMSNLRIVTRAENLKNKSMASNNTSGITGVRWNNHIGKWQAYISNTGKLQHLGFFPDISGAISARSTAERALGYHENHGAEQCTV